VSDPTTPTGKRLFEEWAEVEATQWRADIIAIEQEAAAAAQADADRLAEALRTLDVFRFHLEARHWDKAREALRLHDAAKEEER